MFLVRITSLFLFSWTVAIIVSNDSSILQECQAWVAVQVIPKTSSSRRPTAAASSSRKQSLLCTAVVCRHMVGPQQLGTFEPLTTLSAPSSSSSSTTTTTTVDDPQQIKLQQQEDRYVVLEDYISSAAARRPHKVNSDDDDTAGSGDDLLRLAQQQQRQPLLPYQQGWDIQKELMQEHRQRLDRLRTHQKDGSVGGENTLSPFLDKETALEWQQQQQQQQQQQWQSSTLLEEEENQQEENLKQRQQERDILRGGRDTILFVQHEPVYTLGSGSDESLILNNSNNGDDHQTSIPVVRMNRGGEVTYHGPGMLVVYPVLDLRNYRQDIHWYMRALEEAILLALQDVGIEGARRDEETTGVWIQQDSSSSTDDDGGSSSTDNLYKVAAIGIHCRGWITQHGLAINVEKHPTFDQAFDGIVPCGLHGRKVGYVNQFLDDEHAVTLEQMATSMTAALEEVFRIKLVQRPLDDEESSYRR